MEVGDRDKFNPNVMRDNMHDWVLANENMARVLAAKGYHYQLYLPETPATPTAPSSSKPCPKLWNIYGRDTRSRRRRTETRSAAPLSPYT